MRPGWLAVAACCSSLAWVAGPQADVLKTSAGDLQITLVGHGSVMFRLNDTVVHVDPVGRSGDYSVLPKADLILITHEHGDHLDPKVIELLRKAGTAVVLTEAAAQKFPGGVVMKNGDTRTVHGIGVAAVPAYNLPQGAALFHPKGQGNGYVLTFADRKVYVAGDTENVPEMKGLQGIDVAFLPMNRPYTMTPEMVAEAVRMFRPRIVYPYHFGSTDLSRLAALLADEKSVEVRLRGRK